MDVEVAVHTANGTLWALKMSPNSTVLDLRKRIALEKEVPLEFQVLFEASDELIRIKGPEELTLVISLEEICGKLNSDSRTQIKAALDSMVEAPHMCKHNEIAIAAVTGSCLQSFTRERREGQ